MKKATKVILATILCLIMTAGTIPAVMAEGTGAQGVANAAESYLEKATGADFGWGSDNWCGRFLYKCAEDAGESAAMCGSIDTMEDTGSAMKWFVSGAASVGYFYDEISLSKYGLSASRKTNKSDYFPQIGDIIFYDWDGDHNNLGHMEVLTAVSGSQITTIGGSTGSGCQGTYKGKLHVHQHSYDIGSKFVVAYARPNYGGESPALTISPTSEPGENRAVGDAFYFRGSITSEYPITSATVQVRDADNSSVVMEKTVTPNKTYVDILKDGLDSLKFGELVEGNYYLWLLASDSSGTEKEWSVHFSVGHPAEDVPPPSTMTQYRYHRYVDSAGNVSLCPYYGGSIFHSTMALQYTDWLDQPLTCNSASGGHKHVNMGSACTNSGCIDPSCSTERYTDGSSNWYYEETRTIPADEPAVLDGWESKLTGIFIPVRSWTSLAFSDVPSGTWYFESVKAAYCYALINGRGENQFQPEENLTVAEAITLAARIHAAYYGNTVPVFVGGNWYDGAVSYAKQNGIPVEGAYNAPATREEFVHILAASLPVEELWSNAGAVEFADKSLFQHPDAIDLLCQAGVINGISRNGLCFFDPDSLITRAQVSAVITRMVIPDSRVGK